MSGLKNCPKCGSHRGKQIWDTRYGLKREQYYECFDCGYTEGQKRRKNNGNCTR